MPLFNDFFPPHVAAFTGDRSVDFALPNGQRTLNREQKQYLSRCLPAGFFGCAVLGAASPQPSRRGLRLRLRLGLRIRAPREDPDPLQCRSKQWRSSAWRSQLLNTRLSDDSTLRRAAATQQQSCLGFAPVVPVGDKRNSRRGVQEYLARKIKESPPGELRGGGRPAVERFGGVGDPRRARGCVACRWQQWGSSA